MCRSHDPLVYFLRANNGLLRLTKTQLEARPILKACANGSSEMVSNATSAVDRHCVQLSTAQICGRKNGVASYGVLMYVQFVFAAITTVACIRDFVSGDLLKTGALLMHPAIAPKLNASPQVRMDDQNSRKPQETRPDIVSDRVSWSEKRTAPLDTHGIKIAVHAWQMTLILIETR